jgi:glyoxylase-like metal-dependent hydrolase (beta-lactamase superfamily II)
MNIPLEDNFTDVIGKAQRGLEISDSDLAKQARLDASAIRKLRGGHYNELALFRVAPVLGLGARALADLAQNEYRPDACEIDGLAMFNTTYHDMTVNAFLVWDPKSREAIAFDTGADCRPILDRVKKEKLTVKLILLTHAHVDHVTGVAAAKRALGVPVHLHRDDLFLYERAVQSGALFGLDVEPQPPIDAFFEAGELIVFGEYEARPYHTPGHCPGGVCLQIGRKGETGRDLFVGDTLFAGSIGRTDLPGGDHATLIASIKTVLFAFGDDAVVYPGHGPTTTIGQERRTNPFLV